VLCVAYNVNTTTSNQRLRTADEVQQGEEVAGTVMMMMMMMMISDNDGW